MGIEPTAISPGERFVARGLRDIALAAFAVFARAGRMAWCGALGPPPEINPGYADARNSLGVALVQKGQLDDGIAQFQEVLRFKPDFRLAQDNLSKAQGLLRQNHGHE
jgi:hypothetical protein